MMNTKAALHVFLKTSLATMIMTPTSTAALQNVANQLLPFMHYLTTKHTKQQTSWTIAVLLT
jgi:hypothetical protein